jgi:hypothetical protein
MPFWKITDRGPSKVKEIKFKQGELLEEHLQDWICADQCRRNGCYTDRKT